MATTAPIEVEAALQYATKYADFTTEHIVDGEPVHTLTTLGYATAGVLMAVFVVVNYFGHPVVRGLALVSYLGDYGGQGVISFGWAIPILFALSVVVYAIAYAVRLEPAQVEQHIDDVKHGVQVEEEALGAGVG